ncbi:multicopper oxidase family protein [Haliangium sp.]|uniref:multicopper oxidase family protein n=1 Tax=Haliangium sp. TaxID=2663208 RepID=UPI003D0E4CF1
MDKQRQVYAVSLLAGFAWAGCQVGQVDLVDESAGLEAALGTLSACPATDVIADPPQFQWTFHPVTANNPEPYYSGVMEIGEASFTMNNGDTLVTRAYRQAGTAYTIPGPTMTMEPGNKYVLSFHNTLPFEAASPDHNVFKDPNISNIHTHGLHISGESPGDDVTRSFEGGFGGDFVYDIPADHMGGTYWYHAHHHGSTFLQVSGGAFGLIVIDDGNDGLPANVAAMQQRQLVLGFLDPGAAGTGGDTLIAGTLSSTWTVNGVIQGNLCAPANEWQRWRVLVADRNAMEKTIAVGPQCDVMLLARDGVWRTTAPKDLTTNEISLTGASRADLAVRCSDDSQITVNGNPIANVFVDGAGDPGPHPFAEDGVSTWSANRPAYLRDLRAETGVNTEAVKMGARTINGSKFDHMSPTFTLPADSVQEWSINGAAMHPFHLHVYHVQTLNCGGDFEDGEYYDVVASNCSIRFDLDAATSTPYQGRTIMHCHILEHEDQGAMGWLDVVGGQSPPSFPADGDLAAPYAEYYSLSGGAACGDLSCDPGEDACSCPGDCGPPPGAELSCTDGLDEDCDGDADCADADCSAAPACQAGGCDNDGVCEAGEDCTSCSGDCDGVTSGPPSSRFCCGDGVLDTAEGDGSVCDGNP